MKPVWHFLFTALLLCFLAWPEVTNAQKRPLGRVLNDFGAAVPFAVVHFDASGQAELANIEGYFRIQPKAKEIRISHPEFNSKLFVPDLTERRNDTLLFYLDQQKSLFMPSGANQALGNKVIAEILKRKKTFNPENYEFRYTGYHKLTVRAARLEAPGFIRKFTGRFLQLFNDFSHLAPHLFMMESVTTREFFPRRINKETIVATNATGVSQTSLLTPSTTLQPFNIFNDLFENPSYRFISPLANGSQSRFIYSLTDSIQVGGAWLYRLNFKSRKRYNFDGIEGTLFVEAETFALVAINGKESRKKALPLQFAQSFLRSETGAVFPEMLRLRFELLTGSKSHTAYVAEMTSLLQGIEVKAPRQTPKFDPIYLTSRLATEPEEQEYWNNYRGHIFTPEDQQTYVLYDSLGTRKKLNYLIRFAEKITTGMVPAGKVDVNLYKLLRYNEHEGFRPGIGLVTNRTFSEVIRLSGYGGYGINDREWKMNASIGARLHIQSDTWITFSGSKEVEESGLPWFAFQQNQFSSEWLRALRVRKMDEVRSATASLSGNVKRDLNLNAHISVQERESRFEYSFIPQPDNIYSITEASVGIRYAFREQFVETTNLRHSIGTKFPVLWLQARKGIKGIAEGELNYLKTDAKINYRFRTLSLGTSSFQLIGGFVTGRVPYGLLFSGKGSLRNLSTVNHNSFETMRYNEFLSDRYAGLFISHQFGKLLPNARGFEPTLELLHNMGIGGLRNPQDHIGIGFRTMEKGYFESGFFVNDILVFRIYLLKLSTGTGLFLRYGPYAFSDAGDNVYLKLSIKIGL